MREARVGGEDHADWREVLLALVLTHLEVSDSCHFLEADFAGTVPYSLQIEHPSGIVDGHHIQCIQWEAGVVELLNVRSHDFGPSRLIG